MCTQDGRQHSWNRIMCNSRRGWRCRGACREEAEVIINGEVNRVQVFNWKLILKSFLKRSEGVEEKSFVVVAQGTAPNGSGKEARWWSNPSLYVISGYTYLLRKQCHLEPPQVREEVTVQEYLEAGGRLIQVNIFMTTNCSTIPGGLTSVTGFSNMRFKAEAI